MPRVLLSIGANLGDRHAALQSVVDAMVGRFTDIEVSRVLLTPPWGNIEQPAFLNAAIRATTDLQPSEVLAFAQECERAAHRVRDAHWGPRTLDVDIIDYEGVQQSDPQLTLPHPRAQERAFVLACLADIDPLIEIPGHGNVLKLLHHVDTTGIEVHGELRVPA